MSAYFFIYMYLLLIDYLNWFARMYVNTNQSFAGKTIFIINNLLKSRHFKVDIFYFRSLFRIVLHDNYSL